MIRGGEGGLRLGSNKNTQHSRFETKIEKFRELKFRPEGTENISNSADTTHPKAVVPG